MLTFLLSKDLLATSQEPSVRKEHDRIDGEAFLITNDECYRFWDFVHAIAAAAGYPTSPTKVEELRNIPRWVGLSIGFVAT